MLHFVAKNSKMSGCIILYTRFFFRILLPKFKGMYYTQIITVLALQIDALLRGFDFKQTLLALIDWAPLVV